MTRETHWRLKKTDPFLERILSNNLNISTVLARLLINRGVITSEEAEEFLSPAGGRFYPVGWLTDCNKAVARILAARQRGEKVLICGDYDVDGVTATALMMEVLTRVGISVSYYLPNRLQEGYGLHTTAIRAAAEQGVGLIITVDCGITAVAEAQAAAAAGIDLIITDHHEVPMQLPLALAVINPKRPDCRYPYKNLAGVGVALKLAAALLAACGDRTGWQGLLDLACLGTVADIVPLTGENRFIVKKGLQYLRSTVRPGIKALCAAAGIEAANITVRDIAFILAPRLNAAGRMGDAGPAVELLLTRDEEKARFLAGFLHQENSARQRLESTIFNEAMVEINSDPQLTQRRVIVLAREGWHEGVLGIVAARLMEKLGRPVFLISLQGESGRGSARSTPGFNLYQALVATGEYLEKYGGHAQAAGFTIHADNIFLWQKKLDEYAGSLPPEVWVPVQDVEGTLTLSELTPRLIEEIELLEPFGCGNPEPVFLFSDLKLITWRAVGREGEHCRLLLADDCQQVEGIKFRCNGLSPSLAAGQILNVLARPVLNTFNGRQSVELEIKDVRLSTSGCTVVTISCNEEACTKRYPVKEINPSPSFFWPESIIWALKEVCQGRAEKLLPRAVQAVEDELVVPPVSEQLVDLRNYPGRLSLLVELIASIPGKTAVIVAGRAQVEEMVRWLQRSLPGRKIGCLTQENRIPASALSVSLKEADVLITTPQYITNSETWDHVIYYHLPLHTIEWVKLREMLPYLQRCCLLFNQRDRQKAEYYWRALTPTREVLAHLYLYLKHQGKDNYFNPEVITSFLRQRGYAVCDYTVIIGLEILAELGVITYNKHNGTTDEEISWGWQWGREEAAAAWEVAVVGGKKVDLSSSLTYVVLQETYQRLCQWWDKLLTRAFK